MTREFTAAGVMGMGLLLAACASDTAAYPSLARRDVERAAAAPSPSPSPSPGSDTLPAADLPDPATAAKLPALVASAREAHQRFGESRDRAEKAVGAAAGAAPGSETWAVASIAIASLESARSQAMVSLAELDGLYAAARINGTGGASAIGAARDEVAALVGEEDQVLTALRSRLGS